jgi:hypothetical protein
VFSSRALPGALLSLATLFGQPGAVLAQRGGGGGFVGGDTAGGGGLSGKNGIATGLDTKDDLKGFHDALAVQADSQQTAQYNLMMKLTDAANTELQTFLQETARTNNAAELTTAGKIVSQAIQNARNANNKFLEALSNSQKAGLKDTIRKVEKAESELAQQSRVLDAQVTIPKTTREEIVGSSQLLGRALESFRHEQAGLGEEMSIGAGSGQDVVFTIPPVKSSIRFQDQPVTITTSGTVSRDPLATDQNSFHLQLSADMSDLQQNLTEVLRAELNKSDPCGEQINVREAVFTASPPASVVAVELHYERWTCFGRGIANEMAEGNGTIEVMLTPETAADGTPRLLPKIARVDAQGLVADLLRSGSLGESVRDKVADAILSSMRQGFEYKTLLPPSAQGFVTVQRAQFEGTGSGRLSVVVSGDIRVSSDKLTSLVSELKAGEAKTQAPVTESAPR